MLFLGILLNAISILPGVEISTTWAKEIPPSPQTRVYDEAKILGTSAAELNLALGQLEQQTTHQVVVAVFKSLEGEDLVDYTFRVFQKWKIGTEKADNGVLVAVFLTDRKIRIEVGYGLEAVLTDALSRRMIELDFVPFARQGKMAEGLTQVVLRLVSYLKTPESDENQALRSSVAQRSQRIPAMPFWVKFILFGVVIFFVIFARFVSNGVNLGSHPYGMRRRGGHLSGGGWGGGFGGGGFGGGGFSGGGGSSGGGGASGSW